MRHCPNAPPSSASRLWLIFFLLLPGPWASLSADLLKPMPGAAKRAEPEKVPLAVTLKADKNTYKLRDKINLQVLLRNTSQSTIYIYALLDWGESASVSLWAKDASSGGDLPEHFWGSPPSPPAVKDSFIRLNPNYIYGALYREDLKTLGIERPGRYELVAYYHSPVSAEMSFGLPIISREDGKARSNGVTITVEK